jgi:hypothetical protein
VLLPLLAEEETRSPDFWQVVGANLVVTIIWALVALALFPIFWKVLDLVTPGNLKEELLGDASKNKAPNLAMAIVVGLLGLGFCVIIASAIH